MSVGERTITRSIGGKDCTFHKINVYDRIEILRKYKAQKRESLLADLKAVGADKGEMLIELRDLDETQYGDREVIACINTLESRMSIIERLIVGDEAEKKMVVEALRDPDFDSLRLAADLCNLSVGSPEPDDSAYGEDSPNPPAAEPETYQTPPNSTDTTSTTAAA